MGDLYSRVEIDPPYNRKTNPSKDGKYPIYIVVKKNPKKEIIPVKVKIALTSFQNVENKWVKSNETHARKLNALIRKAKNLIDDKIFELELQGIIQTPKQIKDWYLKTHNIERFLRKNSETLFIDFLEDYITRERKGHNFTAVLTKLKFFGRPVGFVEMDWDYFKSFADFIKSDPEHKVKPASGNQYWHRVKTVYKAWCKELGVDYLEKHFEGISFPNKNRKRYKALTWNEIDSLQHMEITENVITKLKKDYELKMTIEGIKVVRDIFIFMCYTSRYIDELTPLTFEENFFYEGENKDKPVFKGQRPKTEEFFENPLFPKIAEELFWKHNPTPEGQIPKGHFFPEINYKRAYRKFNKILAVLSQELNLSFTMTTTTARRTFQSVIGAEYYENTRMKILGHRNPTTQHAYTVKTSGSIFHEVERQLGNK